MSRIVRYNSDDLNHEKEEMFLIPKEVVRTMLLAIQGGPPVYWDDLSQDYSSFAFFDLVPVDEASFDSADQLCPRCSAPIFYQGDPEGWVSCDNCVLVYRLIPTGADHGID